MCKVRPQEILDELIKRLSRSIHHTSRRCKQFSDEPFRPSAEGKERKRKSWPRSISGVTRGRPVRLAQEPDDSSGARAAAKWSGGKQQ